MSTRNFISLPALVFVCGGALAADGPNLGRPVSETDVAAWDISIGPDGVGLPAGSGTAKAGAAIFAEKCVSCHGEGGKGGPGGALVGRASLVASPEGKDPPKTVGNYWPYATTLFDFIRRDMPWPTPKTLSADETYSLAAYVLQQNGIVGETDVMDKDSLPKVQMPNRNGFVSRYPDKH